MQKQDFAPLRYADISAGERDDLRLNADLKRYKWLAGISTLLLVLVFIVLSYGLWGMLRTSYLSKRCRGLLQHCSRRHAQSRPRRSQCSAHL